MAPFQGAIFVCRGQKQPVIASERSERGNLIGLVHSKSILRKRRDLQMNIPKTLLLIFLLFSVSANSRSLIVITDMEPDDRVALILLAALEPGTISLVGTTGLHAGRKAALARQLMDELGLSDVPVIQGSGGMPADYPDIASSRAALSYRGEGIGLLSDAQLESLTRDAPRSSDDLQKQISIALQLANDVEVVLLAPATDLVLALERDPALTTNLQHIHMMGGWSELTGTEDGLVRRTSYNWNMDPRAAARLMQMREVSMTLYSTHMLKRDFSGGSVNRNDFPEIIELLETKAGHSQWAESFFVAARSWDDHVMEQIPYLVPIIGDRAGEQFMPADPVVALGLSNPDLLSRVRAVDISIDLEDLDPKQGYQVLVKDNSASNIRSIEAIDIAAFEQQALSMIRGASTSNDTEETQ